MARKRAIIAPRAGRRRKSAVVKRTSAFKKSSIFDKISVEMERLGKTDASMRWLQNKIREFGGTSRNKLIKEGKLTGKVNIGKMNFFAYDPKWKKILPYYDIFPLVIPISPKPRGFLGINFHYLPPALRVVLLEQLTQFASDNKFNKRTSIKPNWSALASNPLIKPTVKRYLWKHVKSPFRRIDAPDFPVAILLPVHQFRKASAKKVWSDSRRFS